MTTTPPQTDRSPQSGDESSPGSGRAAHNRALCAYGENVAARYLVAAGLVVLDRNWTCVQGEIDLVLREGDTLVVCEVKTRTSNDYGTPHEAVTPDKLARLRRLAAAWLTEHAANPRGVRIDLVAVLRPPKGPAIVDHVPGLG